MSTQTSASTENTTGKKTVHKLETKNLTIGYGKREVLKNINIEVESGQLLCLLGPNGVGKSTFFKSLLGFIPTLGGEIDLDGKDSKSFSRRDLARKISYVPQDHSSPFPYAVIDMVLTATVSMLGLMSNPGQKQYDEAEKVLEEFGIAHLANRSFTDLSGGEQQIVLIARAVMQDTDLVLMDEPTAALDLSNQVSVLNKVKQMVERDNKGVVMVTHDPDQCFLCANKVVLITHEQKLITGSVDEVVTEANLKEAFGIDVRIVETKDVEGHPLKCCVPLLD